MAVVTPGMLGPVLITDSKGGPLSGITGFNGLVNIVLTCVKVRLRSSRTLSASFAVFTEFLKT
ncbi:hypothetical protein RRF57_011306 [Xylaria bambusicola]|uniref:Uncharacterized protein n=1 Tax=Xylaria bambusicola TaxID=326684 RepID=A0AAN7V2I6_9PEZI